MKVQMQLKLNFMRIFFCSPNDKKKKKIYIYIYIYIYIFFFLICLQKRNDEKLKKFQFEYFIEKLYCELILFISLHFIVKIYTTKYKQILLKNCIYLKRTYLVLINNI